MGGHPVPTAASVLGAQALLEAAGSAGPDDRLLLLLSGGGSALATLPETGLTLADLQQTTDLLLRAGAPIEVLNCVRRRLDRLKGGGLARAAHPAPVRALVLSDVVGDPPAVIASGPVSPDPTSYADAISALRSYGVWEEAPAAVQARLFRGRDEPDPPGAGDRCFESVRYDVIGSARTAAEAASRCGSDAGFATRLLSTDVTGEARDVGLWLAREAQAEAERGGRTCLVAAGETTVTVRGGGRGGRNQEVATAAAQALEGVAGVVVVSFGTDGVDGPTDAAGGMVTGRTVGRARAEGLDAATALADNATYGFLEAAGDLLSPGPTGTNVMDLLLAVVDARPTASE